MSESAGFELDKVSIVTGAAADTLLQRYLALDPNSDGAETARQALMNDLPEIVDAVLDENEGHRFFKYAGTEPSPILVGREVTAVDDLTVHEGRLVVGYQRRVTQLSFSRLTRRVEGTQKFWLGITLPETE